MSITSYANSPYRDDFNSEDPAFDNKTANEKNYLRILFKPAASVQTRELNQIQSILQGQIDKFGRSVFKEGTPVIDGLTSFNNNLFYVDILIENTALINVETGVVLTTYIEQLINLENRKEGETVFGGIKAEVVAYEKSTVTNTYRFFIKYLTSIQDAGENVTLFETVDENIVTQDDITNTAGDAVILAGDTVGHATGVGYAAGVTVEKGVYFIKGEFVLVEKTSNYFSKPSKEYILNGDFSFLVKENIVSYNDDLSLLDNATGTPNYTAPGADRYSIDLSITFISQNKNTPDNTFISEHANVYDVNLLPVNSSFLKLISIIEGRNVIPARTEFSGLERKLAQRTFEESGNYIVDPFVATVSEYLNDETGNNGTYTSQEIVDADEGDSLTTLQEGIDYGSERIVVTVEPAIGYVEGYRVELIDKLNIPVSKARTTKEIPVGITAKLGAYVEGDLVTGLPDIHDNTAVYSISGSGVTCRIRNIVKQSAGVFRLYLYDMVDEIPDTASITLAGMQFDYEGGLKDISNSQSIFELPYDTVSGISNIEVTEFLSFDSTVDVGDLVDIQIPVLLTNTNFESVNINDYLVVNTTSDIVYPVTDATIISSTVVRLTLGTASAGEDVRVLGPVESILPTPENKTINTHTEDLVFAGATKTVALSFSDAFEILDIEADGGSGFESILNGLKPYKYAKLDSGQRDGIYKASQLNRLNLADDTYRITYRYFDHSGAGNFFSALSYNDEGFEQNLTYKGNRLSDVLDFRSKSGDVAVILKPGTLIEADVTYYLPQYNQLVVNTLGEVYMVEGTPEIDPVIPTTPNGTMALYDMYFPAYTFLASDIQKTYLDNKVYTMHDIAKLDKRVSNVENLMSLSLLEKSAAEQTFINEGDGSVRFKNGMIIDTFNDHSIGDVFDPGYSVSADGDEGILRPLFRQSNLPLKVSGQSSDLLSLPYTEQELISQDLASVTLSVSPFDVASWNGTLKLSPSSDEWMETTVRPDILVNLNGKEDGVAFLDSEEDCLGTKWKSWKTNWIGESSRSKGKATRPKTIVTADGTSKVASGAGQLGTSPADDIRDALRKTFEIKTIKKHLGDRIVDANYIPFIRSRKIFFKGEMMKPLTKVHAFFDGTEVTSYCALSTYTEYRELTEVEYFTGQDTPVPIEDLGDLITDANGSIEGYFIIPNHDALRFKTGTRKFRLADSATDDRNNTNTFAEQFYDARGMILTKEGTILSTRPIAKSQERVNETRNVIQEEISSSITYRDPIAQSFVIGNIDSGIFATSIDLYFYSKSDKTSVSVHLVSLENGVPTQNQIPLTKVVKLPSEVNEDILGVTATNFAFEAPVYLEPGVEYAMVVMSNSPEYKIWTAELGEIDITTQNRISKNPYGGVAFKSANGSTWTPVQTQDFKFKLNRAEFTSTSAQFTLTPVFEAGPVAVEGSLFDMVQSSIKLPLTTIEYDLNIGNLSGGNSYDLELNESLQLDSEKTIDNDGLSTNGANVTLDITGTNYVSPMIDQDRLSLLAVKHVVNNDSTDETLAHHGSALSRYITREINLNDPADRVNVYFKANLPSSETSIEVYYRIKSGDDQDISDNEFVLLAPNVEPKVNADGSFEEAEYQFDPVELFSSFQVKVVFLSSNSARVPTIKEFRAIATI